jgi:AGZA family xanthine/uracil permease-like MFS transporter
MMVYIILNTMIWSVVHLSDGRVTPANWHDKEIYNWGVGKKDMPTWMRWIWKMVPLRRRQSMIGRKNVVELVDNDSTIRNSSHHGSSDKGDDIMLESQDHQRQDPEHGDQIHAQQ